jgi:two-component system sensor histidine kinase KdpD
MAIGACAVTTLATIGLHPWLAPVNAVMLFLLTVALVAARLGRGPAVLASFLSVALFDFCAVPPRWSFAVSDAQYTLAFAVMLGVALLISHLTNGLRHQADDARHHARRAESLYALARQLAGALSVEQVCEAITTFAAAELGARVQLLVPDADEHLRPALPDATAPDASLMWQARAAYLGQRGMGPLRDEGDDTVHHALWPLPGSTRSRGVLILSTDAPGAHLLDQQRDLLDALASLLATSLERLHFVHVAHRTQLDIQNERLRASILSALSHDIRTPLTSLLGLADTLTLVQPPLPPAAHDIARAIHEQADSLHRMVGNLLDMARLHRGLEGGALPLRREWQPIEEVIGASIGLLGPALAEHPVKVTLAPDLPLLHIDAVLMERVFGNLFENAAKYAPARTPIHVQAEAGPQLLTVRVRNEGAGFPPRRLGRIFDVFERGEPESAIPGVGLGLSICRAIVEAHGGQIRATNPSEGGAEVSFTLPLGTPPVIEPEALATTEELPS